MILYDDLFKTFFNLFCFEKNNFKEDGMKESQIIKNHFPIDWEIAASQLSWY